MTIWKRFYITLDHTSLNLTEFEVSETRMKNMRCNVSKLPKNIWAFIDKEASMKKQPTVLATNEYGFNSEDRFTSKYTHSPSRTHCAHVHTHKPWTVCFCWISNCIPFEPTPGEKKLSIEKECFLECFAYDNTAELINQLIRKSTSKFNNTRWTRDSPRRTLKQTLG